MGRSGGHQEEGKERMAKTTNEIITDIKFHIWKMGAEHYSDWYVAVSKDPKNQFTVHRVDKEDSLWIYRQAASPAVAREVEDYFVNILGTEGATDATTGELRRDDTADIVYAFRTTPQTEPSRSLWWESHVFIASDLIVSSMFPSLSEGIRFQRQGA